MSESKSTPGPWHVASSLHSKMHIVDINEDLVAVARMSYDRIHLVDEVVAVAVSGEARGVSEASGDDGGEKMIECAECGTTYEPMTDAYACPTCGANNYPSDEPIPSLADLPELTEEERKAMESLGPEFIERILRGERPVTDPTTFAN